MTLRRCCDHCDRPLSPEARPLVIARGVIGAELWMTFPTPDEANGMREFCSWACLIAHAREVAAEEDRPRSCTRR